MLNRKTVVPGALVVAIAISLAFIGVFAIKSKSSNPFLLQVAAGLTHIPGMSTFVRVVDSTVDRVKARIAAIDLMGKKVNSGAPVERIEAGATAIDSLEKEVTPGVPVFGMFDAIGPYRKNGLFEIYGANLRERRQGPIRISQAEIEVSHDEAWAIWAPDHTVARDATHLAIDFVEMPEQGKLTVGFLFDDGGSAAFVYDTGNVAQQPTDLLEPVLPSDLIEKAKNATPAGELRQTGKRLIVQLPAEFIQRFGPGGSGKITHWFLRLNGTAKSTVKIAQMALIRPSPERTDSKNITLSGRVVGSALTPNQEVELIDDTGRSTVHKVALDGGFAFSGVDADKVVSLRLREPTRMHYSNLGRWFVPGYSRSDLIIGPPTRYQNADGHAPNQASAKFIGARVPSTVAAFYEPHSRQYWPGAGAVQEYDSTTFANNHGYIDRDRFFDNPDHCVRIASTGGSDMVALQVRPFEKSNLILEETLGIALGKCVEVISAATDNGDIAVNFPRIHDYTSKFKPDLTLVSTLVGLMFQVNPKMLRDGTGLDPENSSLPNFYYDKKGDLTFRTASPVSPVFTIKPTFPEYSKGIPFGLTLTVPFRMMPKEGLEAFNYWAAITDVIDKTVPGQNFVMHSGVDQAQCRLNCAPKLSAPDGTTVVAGAEGFVRNLVDFCKEKNYKCIQPGFDPASGEKGNYLTFEFDGHYSPRGHQWLAQELTMPLANLLTAKQ